MPFYLQKIKIHLLSTFLDFSFGKLFFLNEMLCIFVLDMLVEGQAFDTRWPFCMERIEMFLEWLFPHFSSLVYLYDIIIDLLLPFDLFFFFHLPFELFNFTKRSLNFLLHICIKSLPSVFEKFPLFIPSPHLLLDLMIRFHKFFILSMINLTIRRDTLFVIFKRIIRYFRFFLVSKTLIFYIWLGLDLLLTGQIDSLFLVMIGDIRNSDGHFWWRIGGIHYLQI